MQSQVGGWVLHIMAIIFRVVAAVIREKAIAVGAVNISGLAGGLVFTHGEYIRLDMLFLKSRCLPHKTFDGTGVALG